MAVGEFDIIERHFRPLTDNRPEAFSLKDDAASFRFFDKADTVFTTDAIVEGVHFLEATSADLIGQKAIRMNVSDLVGKGAEPIAYLLTVGVPRNTPESWFHQLSEGLKSAQEEYGLFLLGGDTVVSPGGVFLSVTMFGEAAKRGMLQRSGGSPGQTIYVTGTIGDGFLGLHEARKEAGVDYLIDRYLKPKARLIALETIRQYAQASMDVSDGLIADLEHLLEASSCGARLFIDNIPLSNEAQTILDRRERSLWDLLTGGDDYEILFTSLSNDVESAFSESEIPVTAIGELVADKGVMFVDNTGQPVQIPDGLSGGHDHFR